MAKTKVKIIFEAEVDIDGLDERPYVIIEDEMRETILDDPFAFLATYETDMQVLMEILK